MGPGSHVGFPISAKNKYLVYDHPMNISAKFGSNLFCGFRKLEAQVSLYRSPDIKILKIFLLETTKPIEM
jgi:hypothetical protein